MSISFYKHNLVNLLFQSSADFISLFCPAKSESLKHMAMSSSWWRVVIERQRGGKRFFRCEVIFDIDGYQAIGQVTWQSSQLPAIATQCQLFKTGSDFGGKQAFRSGTCGTAAGPDQPPSPPFLHKPDIVSRFAKWRRQSQYRGWVIEMAIAERLLSVQVLTPTPDEGSCWRGFWHVCDSPPYCNLSDPPITVGQHGFLLPQHCLIAVPQFE